MFSGGGRRRRGWGPIAGADQEAEIELSVEEAYEGGRRTVTISGPDGPRTLEVTIPAGVSTGSASASPARAARAPPGRRPATSSSSCG